MTNRSDPGTARPPRGPTPVVAYRDGAAHLRDELERETERLLALDMELTANSSEHAETRRRLRIPVASSIDAIERRAELQRYDAALESSVLHQHRRRQRRRILMGLSLAIAPLVTGGVMSVVHARGGELRAGSCATRPACWEEGRCVAAFSTTLGLTNRDDEGGCVARDDARCDRECRQSGLCLPTSTRCVSESHADCRASTACADDGACTKVGDGCAPSRPRHCYDSHACLAEGACMLLDTPLGGRCSAVVTR